MPLGMLGKYERLDVLGHGVSGIVYLGRDTLLNKQVAIKEIDVQAGDVRRFLEEARVMDRLRHPNIVRVDNVDLIEGKVILVMEYVRGKNLQDLLRAEGALPRERALDYAVQILDALDYAHRMQTVHRDIKPANILVSREGQIKLVDFGLAEILATNAYAGGAGTYAYMAPEDFADEDRSDHLSDIWAVGVTLFEMLTAHRPFQVSRPKDPFAWKRALESEEPARLEDYLSDAPPLLQAVLDRALSKDKKRRYQTAGAFRDDVRRFQVGEELSQTTQEFAVVRTLLTPTNGTKPLDATLPLDPPSVPPIQEESKQPAAPPAERTGPGVVVADVRAEAKPPVKKRNPFARAQGEARMSVEPRLVEFGSLRKGDLRTQKIRVRVDGVKSPIVGSVGKKPDWITATPIAFDRTRQTITLTAHSARAWETGDFEDSLTIITEAGTVQVPVRMTVLKPRPAFSQIAFWYLPVFLLTLLPALSVATLGGGSALISGSVWLVPPAALASGALALMLLLVCVAADLGVGERIACGVALASMCFVLGVAAARPHGYAFSGAYFWLTAGMVGATLLLQLLHLSRWKLWAAVVSGLSLLIGGTFIRALLN